MPNKDNFGVFYFLFIYFSLTILLSSLGFICLYSLFLLVLLVFSLNLCKHGCNGGEEEESHFALRIIHVFVHNCEACVARTM